MGVDRIATGIPSRITDESLLQTRHGTDEDLGRMLEEFRPYLLAIAKAELQPQLAAKVAPSDLVQSTLIKGYGHFGDFRGSTPQELARWLRQILRNHLKTTEQNYRRKKRQVCREQRADHTLARPGQLSPSAQALSREERQLLQASLDRLPRDYRQAIELRHAENLTFAELGDRLGRSEEAARKIWARAVWRLQQDLGVDSDGRSRESGRA